jgi:hypothetical protein
VRSAADGTLPNSIIKQTCLASSIMLTWQYRQNQTGNCSFSSLDVITAQGVYSAALLIKQTATAALLGPSFAAAWLANLVMSN